MAGIASSEARRRALRSARRRRRIRRDLESLGVLPDHAKPMAERLDAIGPAPDTDAYAAALRGVVAAHHVYQPDARDVVADPARDVEEIRRLMEGFASELQKLEEGLRIVSAYVGRMQSKASRERGAVH